MICCFVELCPTKQVHVFFKAGITVLRVGRCTALHEVDPQRRCRKQSILLAHMVFSSSPPFVSLSSLIEDGDL